MSLRRPVRIWLSAGFVLALLLSAFPALGLAEQAAPALDGGTGGAATSSAPAGSYYVVQRGDSWAAIAWRNGIPINQLMAANPGLIRPRNVLWPGDRVFIPTVTPKSPTATGYWYTVKPGDTWQAVSRDSGVPVLDLWHANPGALRPNRWLYVGMRLWIPTAPPAAASAPAPAAPAASATAAPTAAATAAPSAGQPIPVITATVTAKAPAASGPVPSASSTATRTINIPAVGAGSTQPSAPITPTVTAKAPAAPAQATPAPSTAPTTAAPTTAAPTTAAPTKAATTAPAQVTAAPSVTAPSATATSAPAPVQPTTAVTATAPAAKTAAPAGTPIPVTPGNAASPAPGSPTRAPATAAPTAGTAGPACPANVDAYSGAITTYLNSPGATADTLTAWLTGCGAIKGKQGGVTVGPIQNPQSKDMIVVIVDPAAKGTDVPSRVLVYHQQGQGYALVGIGEPKGLATVLKVADLNGDGKTEIVWTDTVCSSGACNSTLFVDQWTGTSYQSIIDTPLTTANAEYSFQTAPDGKSQSIVIKGGQPACTLTYTSDNGGPYHQTSKNCEQSACLYNRVVDANKAYDQWEANGFGQAIEAYKSALADTSLKACGNLGSDELPTLRDFARFRLIQALVGSGQGSQMNAYREQMETAASKGAADAFIKSYTDSRSIVQACRDATAYATAHPESYQLLTALWKYMGASAQFAAADLCPLGK